MGADRLSGVGLVVFSLVFAWQSRQLPIGTSDAPGPAYVPLVLAAALFGLGVLVASGRGAPVVAILAEHREAGGRPLAILGAMSFTAVALEPLGYRLTVALFLVFLLAVVERRGAAPSIAVAVALAWSSFWLLDTTLRVTLPRGLLGF